MSPLLKRNAPALAEAELLAQWQGGVVSRRQLYGLGITRWEVKARVRRGAWSRVGDQSVYLSTGALPTSGRLYAAVFQGGRGAALDGDAALVAAGLVRWELEAVRVSVPRGARVRRTSDFNIRQTRRFAAEDVLAGAGPARVRPDVAAVRGALWARSDRQAAYLLSAVAQQGISTPEAIGLQLLRIKRAKRRRLVHALVNDLLDGAGSLGELDVVRELRRRGLPKPDQQVLRRDGANRYFLDMEWIEFRLVLEVDGIHHTWATNVVGDALRQNALSMQGRTVLRLPLLGLRLQPEAFFAQIESSLRAAGWDPRPSS